MEKLKAADVWICAKFGGDVERKLEFCKGKKTLMPTGNSEIRE